MLPPFRGASPRTISGLILVLAILIAADVAANRTALKFLLLPPFGALTYLIFVNPTRVEVNARRVVAAPTLTAIWAWLVASAMGYETEGLALAVVGTMLIMWLLRAHMIVPPMALALLTLLLHQQVRWQVDYPISVAIFTLVLYGIYLIWSRLPLWAGAESAEPPCAGALDG